ncbi:MAG: ligase, partial [Streptosporangiaceae bacterium]
MTTALEKAQPSSLVSPPNGFQPVPPPDKKPRRLGRWFASDAAWPVTTMLVLWPVWWLLGIGEYAPVLFAIPMARRLYLWHASGRRSLRLPPGFGIWLLFLLVTLFSLATISETAPGTMASPVSNRLISYSLRTISYLGATILLLYVGNLTERELPRRRLAALLGMVGLYTVAGGLAGMALPQVKITSPLSYLVPASLQASNGELQEMLHPSLSQVQNFLGYAAGRPTAPFTYTNMWGNSLAILVPWILVAWWSYGKSRKQRRLAAAAAAIAVVPAIYSLNRGLWIGIGFAVVYVAVRLAARGKMAVLGALCGALALAAIVILASPLQSVISQRLDHGASNAGRTAGSLIALQDGLASPVIGWGDTRHQQGSGSSIAVGRTANCRNCGQTPIGGNGQVQLLLI